MNVVSLPEEVERKPRAVAIGSFDGVHRGHRSVLEASRATGLVSTVITFDPHPRIALGNRVDLLTTLERRLELITDAGVETAVVAPFTPDLQRLTPEEFAERYLRAIGAEIVLAGEDFRFGVRRSGDLGLLERLGFQVVVPPRIDGVSRRPRSGLRSPTGTSPAPRRCWGGLSSSTGRSSPATSVGARSDTRRRTSCSSRISPARGTGSTQGPPVVTVRQSRSGRIRTTGAPSGGSSPTCSISHGDLYGERLVVEVWERLRDEAVFESEEELVAQIARDVEATQGCTPAGVSRVEACRRAHAPTTNRGRGEPRPYSSIVRVARNASRNRRS